jgi:hypothetical protein
MVLEFFEGDKARVLHELNQPDSPYCSAAWFLLRHQDYPFSLNPLHSREVDELKVLLWVSRFGFHALHVKNQDKERNEFLQSILVQCTMKLVTQIDDIRRTEPTKLSYIQDLENQIITLWSHVFSPLLKVGTKHGGVPHSVTLLLAAHQFPPKSDWPILVKYVSAVLHGKAEKNQAEHLLESDFFYRLNEKCEDDPDHKFTLPHGRLGIKFVSGLLTVGPPGAILSHKWQYHLLTTENVVIPDQLYKYVFIFVLRSTYSMHTAQRKSNSSSKYLLLFETRLSYQLHLGNFALTSSRIACFQNLLALEVPCKTNPSK